MKFDELINKDFRVQQYKNECYLVVDCEDPSNFMTDVGSEDVANFLAASPKLYRRLKFLTDTMRREYPGIAETNDKLLAEARGEK